MALLFSVGWVIVYLLPTTNGFIVGYILSRIGTALFLFNLYNYTAVAFPTRIRSVGVRLDRRSRASRRLGRRHLLGPLYAVGTEPSRLDPVHHYSGRTGAGDY